MNQNAFIESQSRNIYFNQKIFFDNLGNLNNSNLFNDHFGFINILNYNQIYKIINSSEFNKIWFSSKEKIDICKDCEFRYMCQDERIPSFRNNNEWYHKTDCNYNPYLAKWQGEQGYKTLTECGVISNENGFSIDHEKITEINKELWGE